MSTGHISVGAKTYNKTIPLTLMRFIFFHIIVMFANSICFLQFYTTTRYTNLGVPDGDSGN